MPAVPCAARALLAHHRIFVRAVRSEWTHSTMMAEVYGGLGPGDADTVELWGQRETLHVYDTRDWQVVVGSLSHDPDARWRHRRMVAKGGASDVDQFHRLCTRAEKVRSCAVY